MKCASPIAHVTSYKLGLAAKKKPVNTSQQQIGAPYMKFIITGTCVGSGCSLFTLFFSLLHHDTPTHVEHARVNSSSHENSCGSRFLVARTRSSPRRLASLLEAVNRTSARGHFESPGMAALTTTAAAAAAVGAEDIDFNAEAQARGMELVSCVRVRGVECYGLVVGCTCR